MADIAGRYKTSNHGTDSDSKSHLKKASGGQPQNLIKPYIRRGLNMYDFVRSSVMTDVKDPDNLAIILAANLTAKQQWFCMEYLIDCNATKAAIRAGYSRHSARWIAYELRCKHYIRVYIRELMDRTIERVNKWPTGSCYRGRWRGVISDKDEKKGL